ncbi:MAG: peptidoglycan-binding protein [Reyranellaceae bacterium]
MAPITEKPPAAAAPRADGAPPPPVADAALPALLGRAEAGEVAAQLELGRRYVQGVGVGRNEVEAAKWLTRAAAQGNGQAQFNVGVMYERGIGVTADIGKAIDYYRRSAAQNVPMAWHNLALLHAGGAPGLKADPAQARQFMIRAAELGQIESQYSLSLMYLQGVGGAADRVTAMSWLAVAARPNQPKLIEAAKQLSAQLSDGDRQRAQKLAEGHVRRISANLQKLQSATTTAAASADANGATPATPRAIDKAAIAEMQKLMISLKLYDGAADGLMGPRTGAAIRQFQEMAGLPVDGKPSIAVLESLREIAELSRQ